jgi:hypothetical protein
MRYWLLSSFAILTGCMTAPAADDQGCAPPARWRDVAEAAEGQFLVVGELHGTNEIPAAFGSYVCAAAKQGGRTLVGLEIHPKYAEAINAASGSGDPEAVLLMQMPDFWSGSYGLSSEAMLRLIGLLTTIEGVDIVPFNGDFPIPEFDTPEEVQAWFDAMEVGELQQLREEAMAGILSRAFEGYDRAIVLVGNIHAAETKFDFLEGADNMAMLLPGEPVSLNYRSDGGTAWNNQGEGGKPNLVLPSSTAIPSVLPVPSIGLTEATGPAYDGYLYVGTVTASPPAGR